MRIRTRVWGGARAVTRKNGQTCQRCKKFGTFAPGREVCDRCVGALPLVFIVVTVVHGGDQ
jgi:hypothetical protein